MNQKSHLFLSVRTRLCGSNVVMFSLFDLILNYVLALSYLYLQTRWAVKTIKKNTITERGWSSWFRCDVTAGCLLLKESLCRLDSQNWNQQFSNQTLAPLTIQTGSARMPIMVKAYYGINHENRMFLPFLCPYLGQLTVARAVLDSQLYQHPANPSDSHMDLSGRRVRRGLQGQEGGCYEDVHTYPTT